MVNRAYLQCFQRRTKYEIVASYSVPTAWYDLFGPADFHIGADCPLPDACNPSTSSYFLTTAPGATITFGIGIKKLAHRKT